MATPTSLLQPGEELLVRTRQHVLVPISRFLSGLALIALLVAAGLAARAFQDQRVFFLPASQFILGSTTLISLLLAINLIWEYLRWRAECYILSDQRILLVSHLLPQQADTLQLDQIRDVSLHQNVLGRVVNFGHLEIQLREPDASYTLEYVPRPWAMLHRVQEACRQVQQGYGYLRPPQPADAHLAAPPALHSDLQHSLEELARLRDRGILSLEEFEARRRDLLSRH